MCDTDSSQRKQVQSSEILLVLVVLITEPFRWFGTSTLTIEMWKAELELVRMVLVGDSREGFDEAVQV
jgi:hypothetical protein